MTHFLRIKSSSKGEYCNPLGDSDLSISSKPAMEYGTLYKMKFLALFKVSYSLRINKLIISKKY